MVLSLVVVFVIIGFVISEGMFLFSKHQDNFFVYALVLIINVIVFFILFKWYGKFHEKSIENLEEALDLLSESGKLKIIRLHNIDEESRECTGPCYT